MTIAVSSRIANSLYVGLSPSEGTATLDSRNLSKQLHVCRSQLNLLERWQLFHYKERALLGWVAKFILKLCPHSQTRLDQIDLIETQLKNLILQKEEGLLSAHSPTISTMCLSSIASVRQGNLPTEPVITGEFLRKEESTCTLHPSKTFKFWQLFPRLLADREFMLVAVKKDGYDLKFVSARLKADSEVVLAAIEQNGITLQYAGAELQKDKAIVLAASGKIV